MAKTSLAQFATGINGGLQTNLKEMWYHMNLLSNTYCSLYLAHPLFYLPSWTPYVTFFGMTSLTFHLYSSIFYLLPHHCTCLYHWTHHPLLKFLIHFFQSSTKFIWGKELCLFITQPQDLIHFLTCNRYLANIHRQLYGANFLPN